MISLLSIASIADARHLRTDEIGLRPITTEEFEHLFKLFDAFWVYQGEPRSAAPHAITREGKCTNGFINCMAVLEYANLCELLAKQLLFRLAEANRHLPAIDLVVDASYSGTDLGQNVALHIMPYSARHRTVEKDSDGNPTKFRGTIDPDERILLVNELMTTASGSAQMAKDAVIKAGAKPEQFVPYALIMVNRSADAETMADGTKVISLARYHLKTFEPGSDTCPYCAVGSPRYKPKEGTNWRDYFSGS
jgi:orotate phosphoribosyltransferase